MHLATDVIRQAQETHHAAWQQIMARKLGLTTENGDDARLIDDWLAVLHQGGADFTLAFRYLADAIETDSPRLLELFRHPAAAMAWLARWRARLAREPLPANARRAAMHRINPLYIPRNHLTEAALAAAERDGDLAPFERLLEAVTHPFDEQPERDGYEKPAPAEFGAHVTYCGT